MSSDERPTADPEPRSREAKQSAEAALAKLVVVDLSAGASGQARLSAPAPGAVRLIGAGGTESPSTPPRPAPGRLVVPGARAATAPAAVDVTGVRTAGPTQVEAPRSRRGRVLVMIALGAATLGVGAVGVKAALSSPGSLRIVGLSAPDPSTTARVSSDAGRSASPDHTGTTPTAPRTTPGAAPSLAPLSHSVVPPPRITLPVIQPTPTPARQPVTPVVTPRGTPTPAPSQSRPVITPTKTPTRAPTPTPTRTPTRTPSPTPVPTKTTPPPTTTPTPTPPAPTTKAPGPTPTASP